MPRVGGEVGEIVRELEWRFDGLAGVGSREKAVE